MSSHLAGRQREGVKLTLVVHRRCRADNLGKRQRTKCQQPGMQTMAGVRLGDGARTHIGLRRARRVSSAHRRKSAKKDARSVRAFSLKTNPGGHHLHRTAKKSPFRRSMPSTPTTSCAELKARRRASTPTSTKKRKAKMQHDMTRARGAHAKDIFSQLHVP